MLRVESRPLTSPTMRRARSLCRCIAAAVAVGLIGAAAVTARAPQGFVGMNLGQYAFTPGVGGVPTNCAETDRAVGLAAAHGLTILPVVIYTPASEGRLDDCRVKGALATAVCDRR
jgi:hypothetical protein